MAVKIPYGSTLRPLKNKLSPFKTEIPEVLRQKYGGTKLSRKLRTGLLKAEEVALCLLMLPACLLVSSSCKAVRIRSQRLGQIRRDGNCTPAGQHEKQLLRQGSQEVLRQGSCEFYNMRACSALTR